VPGIFNLLHPTQVFEREFYRRSFGVAANLEGHDLGRIQPTVWVGFRPALAVNSLLEQSHRLDSALGSWLRKEINYVAAAVLLIKNDPELAVTCLQTERAAKAGRTLWRALIGGKFE
jgi:hypothetical protein